MRQTTIFTLLVAAVMSVAVFYLKYQVTDLEAELERLNGTIVSDRQTIHVLRAEWSHLNDASRLRALAPKYLKMAPTRPDQIVDASEIPNRPPASMAERRPVDNDIARFLAADGAR